MTSRHNLAVIEYPLGLRNPMKETPFLY